MSRSYLFPKSEDPMATDRSKPLGGFQGWCRNIFVTVATVARSLVVTMRYWILTYDPDRKTFTEKYEYPELPLEVAPRYRGFHRFDLTTCIACDRCARDCPVDCIYIG
ncbi:MAG: 4Fe-4S binding protein, partial [Thermoguttaceae bacterium]